MPAPAKLQIRRVAREGKFFDGNQLVQTGGRIEDFCEFRRFDRLGKISVRDKIQEKPSREDSQRSRSEPSEHKVRNPRACGVLPDFPHDIAGKKRRNRNGPGFSKQVPELILIPIFFHGS